MMAREQGKLSHPSHKRSCADELESFFMPTDLGDVVSFDRACTHEKPLRKCSCSTLFPRKFPEARNRDHYLISNRIIEKYTSQGQVQCDLFVLVCLWLPTIRLTD